MTLRRTNTAAIAKYIEHRPSYLEASLQGSDEPMIHKARGSYRPPIPERAFAWLDDGLYFFEHEPGGKNPVTDHHVALKYQSALNAIIESYRHGIEAQGGVPLSRIVEDAWRNPVAVPTWEDEQGAEWAALQSLCSRVAGNFAGLYPSVEIGVELNPGDERVSSLREAADKDKTIAAHDSYRRIVTSIEKLEAQDYSREAAKAVMSEGLDCSIGKVERAVTFVNKEREGTA